MHNVIIEEPRKTLMNRLPNLSPETMSAAQFEVFKSINSGPRGRSQGPFTALLYSPELTRQVERLGVYIRYNCRVPSRQRELAICLVGADWHADFEWHVHEPLALKAGIPAVALDQISRGQAPVLKDPLDRVTSSFVRELLQTRRVSDATYGLAVEAFGEAGVVDLTGLVGYYTLLAMTLNTFEVPVPEGADIPWAKDTAPKPV